MCRTAYNCRPDVQRNCLQWQLNPRRPTKHPDIQVRLNKVKVFPCTDLLQTTALNWFETASFTLISWCSDQKAPCCFSHLPPLHHTSRRSPATSQVREAHKLLVISFYWVLWGRKRSAVLYGISPKQSSNHKNWLTASWEAAPIAAGCPQTFSCWLSPDLPPLQLRVPSSTQPVSSI